MTAEFGNDLDIATARNLVALWRREIGQEKTARLMALLTLWLEEWPYQRAGTKAAELREAGKMPDDTSSVEIERPLDVVALQAEDKHLWARAVTLTEAMFQSALRRLHAAVEGDAQAAELTALRKREITLINTVSIHKKYADDKRDLATTAEAALSAATQRERALREGLGRALRIAEQWRRSYCAKCASDPDEPAHPRYAAEIANLTALAATAIREDRE